jgi:tricorn protease
MRWVRGFLACAALFTSACIVAQELPEGRELRFPDIHGDKVAFVYGGDIWLVPATGGAARRITADAGRELFPKFSPDGKWIAYTDSPAN